MEGNLFEFSSYVKRTSRPEATNRSKAYPAEGSFHDSLAWLSFPSRSVLAFLSPDGEFVPVMERQQQIIPMIFLNDFFV
jgi:hypothetical protein